MTVRQTRCSFVSQGFALAAVLWLLAGIAVVITGVSEAVKSAAQTNQALRQRVSLLQAEQQVVAELSYLVGTNRLAGAGVAVGDQQLRLDGASYRISNDPLLEVRLQDRAGLISVEPGTQGYLSALLTQCGVDLSAAQRLADAAADYVDSDDLKRLQGAERFDYSGSNLPAPSNRRLNTREELSQVFGWKPAQAAHVLQPCIEAVQSGEDEQVNLWTAPVAVLRSVGMSESLAQTAVAERAQTSGFTLSPTLLAFSNLPENRPGGFMRFADRPSGAVQVQIRHAEWPAAREFLWARGSAGQLQAFLLTHTRWTPGSGAKTPATATVTPRTLRSFVEVSNTSVNIPNANTGTPSSR